MKSGWVRSSRCDTGSCVEVQWRRSQRCDTGNCVEVGEHRCDSGACVEACQQDGEILVRDSKDPDGAVLRFTPDEWAAFTAGVQAGEFQFS